MIVGELVFCIAIGIFTVFIVSIIAQNLFFVQKGKKIVNMENTVVTGITAIRQFHILSAVYFDILYPW